MKALVYGTQFDIEVKDVPTPSLGAGEAMIRVLRAGICGSDVHGVKSRSERRKPPLIMGHEVVGVVEEVSGKAEERWLGKTVAVNPQVPCGTCTRCRGGREQLCAARDLLGATRAGGFGDFMTAPVDRLHELPAGVDVDMASLVEPLATCVHALNSAPPVMGSDVVVLGAGAIGLLAAQLARFAGCGRLFVSEPSKRRREQAREVGDFVVAPGEILATTETETAGRGVPLVIDAVGMEATRACSLKLLEPGGTALWIGMHEREATVPAFEVVTLEKRIQGIFAYNNAEFSVATKLICSGRLKPVVEMRPIPLGEGAKAFNQLLEGSDDPEKVVLVGEPKR